MHFWNFSFEQKVFPFLFPTICLITVSQETGHEKCSEYYKVFTKEKKWKGVNWKSDQNLREELSGFSFKKSCLKHHKTVCTLSADIKENRSVLHSFCKCFFSKLTSNIPLLYYPLQKKNHYVLPSRQGPLLWSVTACSGYLLPGVSQVCLSALDFSLQPLILLPEQLLLLLRQLVQFIPV